jgi:uncharacterized protein YbjT (DUF2867 family)
VICIAGGTGRLGTATVRRLTQRGLPVRVLTRDPTRAAHLVAENVEVIAADVRDPVSLRSAVAGADVVVSAVHGFAGPGGVSPRTVDRDGNAHLVDAARAAGADVVLMSVVGAAPDHPMELFRMKYAAEQHLLASGVPSTIVRSTAFLELWIELLQPTKGRPMVFGRGNNPINLVSVSDVAALVDRVIVDASTRGTTVNIGGPENLTLNQLADAIQHAAGRSDAARHIPRLALAVMANTVGRVKPELGRQARAALAMDRVDLTFDSADVRRAHPELPLTYLASCLPF